MEMVCTHGFEDITDDELRMTDGGSYNLLNVLELWTFCYGAGYAIGQAIRNWRK